MNSFTPHKKIATKEKVVISMRLDREKLETIDKMSYEIDISRNEFINQCIDFALKHMENARY